MRANYYNPDPERREPEPIDDLLGSIIERVGADKDLAISELVASWESIVPEAWRGRSRPIGVRERTLLVEVPSGAVASLLRYDSASLVSVVTDRFGPDLVHSVRFRVAGDVRGGKP
jgi:predicted nucleic acid-binding Zn ribbon protein